MSRIFNRFFSRAHIMSQDTGFAICLDERHLKTPAQTPIILASEKLASAVAEEWNQCGDKIDPASMPLTQLVNTSLDRIPHAADDFARAFIAYGENDLLCYYATHPSELIERQEKIWTPVRTWCAESCELHFMSTTGCQPITQPPETLARLRDIYLSDTGDGDSAAYLRMGGLSHAATLCGSAILALAIEQAHLTAQGAFEAAFVDEHFQMAQWGADDDMVQKLAARRADIEKIVTYFEVLL